MNALQKLITAALLLAVLAASGYADGCYRGTRSSYSYSHSYSYATPTYSYAAPTYQAPAYVAPVKPSYEAYRFLLAFPVVELPSYGAVYQPAVAAAVVPPASALQSPRSAAFEETVIRELKSLGKGLQELGDRVERIERTGRSVPQQPAPQQPQAQPQQQPKQQQPEPIGPPDVEKDFGVVNAASCAMCHQRGNEKNGGGFVFSEADGAPVLLTAEQREEVQRQLVSGTMPLVNTAKAQQLGVKALSKEGRDVLFRELDRQIVVAGNARKAAKK